MQSILEVPAPAKLNLFLHVVGRRHDGYHLIQSAFALIDWMDTLHFELRQDGQLSREDLTTPLPADDLVLRAARALQMVTGTALGAHIGVEKHIPSQAGMGGGSSDAASCLLALNRLWGLRLPLGALVDIGASLGADVPFFLAGGNAWVEGIGERIAALALPPAHYLVAKPPQGLDTAAVFRHPDLKRDSDAARISGFAANPLGFGRNDLQPVARQLCPDVSQALSWLETQGLDGRMTGSGSAVFASVPEAFRAADAPDGWRVRVCSGMDVHPLQGWAASDELPADGS